jgi:hypothetical protein
MVSILFQVDAFRIQNLQTMHVETVYSSTEYTSPVVGLLMIKVISYNLMC